MWQANAALREAELGNAASARQGAVEALAMSPGRDVKLFTALTFARVGETERAKAVIEEMEKSYPSDTLMKVYWLPALKAAIELHSSNPAQAMVFLEAAWKLLYLMNWDCRHNYRSGRCTPSTFGGKRS